MTDGMDFSAIMAQAQEMQSKMLAAQQAQAQTLVQGTAGGGKVVIDMNGNGEFKKVEISAEVVDPSDVSMLEDLVLAALNDGNKKVADIQMEALDGLDLPEMTEGE